MARPSRGAPDALYDRTVMHLAASTRAPRLWHERLLTTRIVTAVGLALLLLLGSWTAGHRESGDLEGAGSGSVVAVADAEMSAVDGVVAAEDGGAALVDLAACLFGIVCCLLLLAAITSLRTRISRRVYGRLRRPHAVITAFSRRFVPAMTLSQLALSRT